MKFTQVDEALRDERTQLAKDASAKLGYKKLAQAILCPDALLFKLRELEIEPLSPLAVENYKRKKARPGMWSDTRLGLQLVTAAAVLAIGVVPYLTKNAKWDAPAPNSNSMAVLTLVALSIVMTVMGIIQLFDFGHNGAHRTRREWKRVSIAEFSGNVPEFALRKALQLKAHGANIRIDYLEETSEAVPHPLPDPFLVAILGDEAYYIDVWDEKEYKA